MFKQRRGLSLLEIVVALGLVATLLVSLLLSHGRLTRQERMAQQRLSAIELADELLTTWTASEPMAISAHSGVGGSQREFEWRLAAVAGEPLPLPGLHVLRLEVYSRGEANRSNGSPPLANVEFLSTAPLPGDGSP